MTKHVENPALRTAQQKLAQEVTALVHGEAAMNLAWQLTDVLTGRMTIDQIDEPIAEALRQEIPAVQSPSEGSIIDALVATSLASSSTEARRLLQGNAISINGTKLTRDKFEPADFQHGRLLLRRGKAFKDSALVELPA